jgi:hypothetical protein
VLEHSFLVLFWVEEECLGFGICPFRDVGDIPIQPTKMGRDGSVKTRDNAIENFLLHAHGFKSTSTLETVFLVDQFPNFRTIVP